MECIFCKIIKGEIPAEKVYEDDDIIAFLDINPINFGHTLVLPKKHYESLVSLPNDLASKLMNVIKKLSACISKAMDTDSFNIFLNNGVLAGQEIPHLHFHIVPRHKEDEVKIKLTHKKYEADEIKRVGEKIRKELEK